jgi:hypothetical protein
MRDERLIPRQESRSDDLHMRFISSLVQLEGEKSLGADFRLAPASRCFERTDRQAVNLEERPWYFVTRDEERSFRPVMASWKGRL